VRRSLQIVGSYGSRVRSDVPRLLSLVESGILAPTASVTRRYALEDAPEAYAALDRREIVGRAIVTTSPS
jgi:S-(hydroxymethyl)glutathione dehydrogenase/alcohol dehydrogenase